MQAFHRALAEIAAQRHYQRSQRSQRSQQSGIGGIGGIPIDALHMASAGNRDDICDIPVEALSSVFGTINTTTSTPSSATPSTPSSATTAHTSENNDDGPSSEFGLTLTRQEQITLQQTARSVAFRHLLEPSVLAACTCFLDLCGLDLVRETLRVVRAHVGALGLMLGLMFRVTLAGIV